MQKLNTMVKRLKAIKKRLKATTNIDDFKNILTLILEEMGDSVFETQIDADFYKDQVNDIVNIISVKRYKTYIEICIEAKVHG